MRVERALPPPRPPAAAAAPIAAAPGSWQTLAAAKAEASADAGQVQSTLAPGPTPEARRDRAGVPASQVVSLGALAPPDAPPAVDVIAIATAPQASTPVPASATAFAASTTPAPRAGDVPAPPPATTAASLAPRDSDGKPLPPAQAVAFGAFGLFGTLPVGLPGSPGSSAPSAAPPPPPPGLAQLAVAAARPFAAPALPPARPVTSTPSAPSPGGAGMRTADPPSGVQGGGQGPAASPGPEPLRSEEGPALDSPLLPARKVPRPPLATLTPAPTTSLAITEAPDGQLSLVAGLAHFDADQYDRVRALLAEAAAAQGARLGSVQINGMTGDPSPALKGGLHGARPR